MNVDQARHVKESGRGNQRLRRADGDLNLYKVIPTKALRGRDEEKAPTASIVALAIRFGRCDYRRVPGR